LKKLPYFENNSPNPIFYKLCILIHKIKNGDSKKNAIAVLFIFFKSRKLMILNINAAFSETGFPKPPH